MGLNNSSEYFRYIYESKETKMKILVVMLVRGGSHRVKRKN